jgi:hypothetical protein
VNKITPLNPGISVTLANNATVLRAGVPNPLVLSSMAAGIALDGTLAHARDAAGTPVGSYLDTGGVFVPFPGCGLNGQGLMNGVVHSMLITCNVRAQPKSFPSTTYHHR